ncbi:MAG: ABC transporter substrate-binding protein [Haloarculaceae archaeon]
MPDESSRYRDRIDRRRFVELTGVAGAAALAGCGGSSDGGDGGDGGGGGETDTPTESSGGGGETDTPTESSGGGESETETGTQVYDKSVMDISFLVPANVQFNSLNPTNASQILFEQLFDPYTKYNFASGEFQPYAVQDWQQSGDTFEMTLRDGLTWQNGDPVKAEDLATQFRLQRTIGTSLWDYIDSVEAVDDQTVTLHLSSENTNPNIIKFNALINWVQYKKSKYEDYVGNSEDLSTFQDRDPIASGPFTLGSMGQQEGLVNRRDDHPDSGNINFNQYGITFLDGNQAAQQALLNLEVDAAYSLFTPPRVVANMPDAVVEARPPAKWGMCVGVNHDKRHVGERKVRQAIAHVIDREQVIQNAGPRTKATPQIPTGITTDDQERWLGDQMGTYQNYGPGSQNTDKATQLLNDAGYSKDGGTWKDSNGRTVSLPMVVPAGWSDWVSATQTIVDQLSGFGFDAAVNARSYGTVAGQVWANGDFKVASMYWTPGGAQSAFPYFPLEWQLIHGAHTFTFNYDKEEVTVPSRTGSGQETVNVTERVPELAQTTDEQRSTELVRKLAWVANQDLPMIPIQEKLEQSWITDDEFDAPDEGSDALMTKWPCVWLPRQGEWQYTG